MECIYIIGEM